MVDVATGDRFVCKGVVPDFLLDKWKMAVGDYLICQIELFVMVLLRWQFHSLFCHRRSIWWVDTDAARYCIIKGLSPSPLMRDLVREYYAVDSWAPSYSWIERVPSKSNVADGPSRDDCGEALSLLGVSQVTPLVPPEELVLRLS